MSNLIHHSHFRNGVTHKLKGIPSDLVGQKYGKLTVIRRTDERRCGHVMWECQCECGRFITTIGFRLKNGDTKSCGCILGEKIKTHGMKKTPEYKAWDNIKHRCNNPKDKQYHNYGGRGIEIGWSSFEDFYSHVGKRPSPQHSIDRIENDKGYVPGNVRWATRIEQANNRRTNFLVTFNNEVMSIAEFSRKHNLDYNFVRYRLTLGWSLEKILSTKDENG